MTKVSQALVRDHITRKICLQSMPKPQNLPLVQEEQNKELSQEGSQLITNLEDIQSEFNKQEL